MFFVTEEPVEAEIRSYVWVLDCPCGERLKGDSEDDIVEVATAHLAELHPHMADQYEREHILFMAMKFRA